MGKKKVDVVENLMNLSGILNMHERAAKAGVPCKLNGERRKFNMMGVDCETAACLYGSACLTPYFQKLGFERELGYFTSQGFQYDKLGITRDEAKFLFDTVGYPYTYLKYVTIEQVRSNLFKLLRKYGGEEAVERAKVLKERGDKLRMGIE
jgi:hypothetical protein